ncbi:MAG: response regulator [Flavobacteriaceae bacterium]
MNIIWVALLWLFFASGLKIAAQEKIIQADTYSEKISEVKQFIKDGKYDKVLEQTLLMNEFLKTRKDITIDSLNILFAKNYYNLCYAYLFLEPEKSLVYADSSISRSLKTNSPSLKQQTYSIKYYVLYDVKGEEKTLDFIADQCIRYALEAKNDKMIGESYMHKCNSLAVLGKPSEAISYCNMAAEIFEKVSDDTYLSSVLNNIGNVFVKINEPKTALEFYQLSYEKSLKVNSTRDVALSARNMADQYENLNQWEKAAKYHKIFGDSIESHYTQLIESNFTEAEAKFNFEQKDKEIAQQQLEIARQKNSRNVWIFSSLAFILVGLGIFQWQSNRQKRKKLFIETELQKEQEINDIRSKFLGNIAHEIRTPLTLISGNLNLALDHLKDPQKLKEHITTALQNSSKVTEDANEILTLLKYEKDKTKIRLTPVLLNEQLSRIVYSFNSLAQMKEIDLSFLNTIPESFKTAIDIEKLEKIINNLLSNAIKFSPSKSKISVAATLINSQLEVKVADQGEGIHFDEKEKIFERFYQSKNNSAVGGIGIGLSLSREFAKILGGHLSVISKLGKGSTFTLQLPVTVYQGEIDSVIEKPKKVPKERLVDTVTEASINPERRAKILITEDNPQMAKFLNDILASEYDCTLAFDGKEALEILQRESFDLITSDIMMPKMDGFELKKAVNKIPEYQHIPFILISAKTLEEDKIRGFKMGIDDYVVKPFSKNELMARVANLLTHKKQREKWQLQNQNLVADTESSDKKLLKKIESLVIENLNNESYKIESLAQQVHYSQRQLTRILKQYTGMTPVQFILEIRLQKAYQLLQHKTHFTLSEVRYDVGISSSPYFNKKFRERFGILPADLLSERR